MLTLNIFGNSNNTYDNYKCSKTLEISLPNYIKYDFSNINNINNNHILLSDDTVIYPNFIQKPFTNLYDLLNVVDRISRWLLESNTKIFDISFNKENTEFIEIEEISNEIKRIVAIFLHDDVNLFVKLSGNSLSDVGDNVIFDDTFPPDDKLEQVNIYYEWDSTIYDSTIIDVQSINDAIIIQHVKVDEPLILIQITRDLSFFEKLMVTKYMQCVFSYRNTDDYDNIITIKKKLLFEDICNAG